MDNGIDEIKDILNDSNISDKSVTYIIQTLRMSKEENERLLELLRRANSLTSQEASFKTLITELECEVDKYEILTETGNSKGEHKSWYKGKYEAYSYCVLKLKRMLKWHSIINED